VAEFQIPLDIANRALQDCGASRIVGFTDDSKAASEVNFLYDKCRTAELRRNVWRFSTRRAALRPIDTTTMELVPAPWGQSNLYIVGSLVAWLGQIYFSTSPVNQNLQPDQNPGSWTLYFGPMTITPWRPTTSGVAPDGTTIPGVTSYFSGELVYVTTATGTTVYVSLQTGNVDNPAVLPAWSSTTTYNKGATIAIPAMPVLYNGVQVLFNSTPVVINAQNYQSTVDLNLNNYPGLTPEWELIPAGEPDVMQGQNWLRLDSGFRSIQLIYPVGAGPLSQSSTRNIYQLPNGYLRVADQNPKQGNMSWLGRPSAPMVDDWVYEGNYLISSWSNPIVFRFAADVADVSMMDPMFCEALAARIALGICETLTQSQSKLAAIGSMYNKFVSEARTVNGIEVGPAETPLDDWVACRA